MGIKKLDVNYWLVDAHIRSQGRTIRRRERFEGTRREATDRCTYLKQELRDLAGETSGKKRIEYLGEALELFDKRSPVPPRRRGLYNQLLNDLGAVAIRRLPDELEKYLKLLKVTPSKAIKRPLSDASLNRLMQLLMAALNLAVKLEVLDKNPVTRTRFPKFREVPRDRVLTPEELTRLREVMREEAPHLCAFFEFALLVPCRKSELVNMETRHLDLAHRCIRVPNGTTKNDVGLWKPIPPSLMSYFESIPAECPYVFYRIHDGKYKPLGDFKKAWKRCLKKANVPDFRVHDLRHISSTALVDNGTPERVVMQVAGWKTPMLSTYYHKAGKNALALVRFDADSGHEFGTKDALKAEIC